MEQCQEGSQPHTSLHPASAVLHSTTKLKTCPEKKPKLWATWTRCETKALESSAATSASAHSSESFL